MAIETGAHTDDRVVASDLVAANQAKQSRGKGRPDTAPRLAGNENIASACRESQQLRELCRAEVMKEEVRHQCRACLNSRPLQEFENVSHFDFDVDIEFPELIERVRMDYSLAIDQHDAFPPSRISSDETEEQCSIPSARVHDAGYVWRKQSVEDRSVAHDAIQAYEV